MASIFQVRPETVTREFQWTPPGSAAPVTIRLDLRKRLTVGEERRMMTAGWGGMRTGGAEAGAAIDVNWRAQTFTRALVYIVDWSLTDEKDTKLPLTLDVVETLQPSLFSLIEGAINAHVEAMQGEAPTPAGTPGQ